MKALKSERLPMLEDIMYTEPKDWQKKIRTTIQHVRQAHSKAMKQKKYLNNGSLDLERAMEKRRTSALITSLDKLSKHQKMHAGDWITFNIFSESYAPLQNEGHILTAASIWILDRLSELDIDEDELFNLLPRDFGLIDTFFDIDVWDCQYEEDLVASVEYVLHYRNKDIAPLERDGGEGERVITSNLAAEGRDHADVPSRQAFDSLLGLLPQRMKEEAVKRFEECYKAWTERFFVGIDYLQEQYLEKCKALNNIRKEINQIRDKLDEKSNQLIAKRERKKKIEKGTSVKPTINALLLNPMQAKTELPKSMPTNPIYSGTPISSLMNEDNGYDPEITSLLKRLENLDDKHEKIAKEIDENINIRGKFLCMIGHRGYLTSDYVEETFPKDIHETLLKPLQILDPYEMCFALLYSVETGSDIPWLYGSCIAMMSEVVDILPWGLSDYSELEDPYLTDEPPTIYKVPEFPDWYKREYGWKGDDEYELRSLAQIVYETTGCLMPRDLHQYDAELKKLGKYGIKQNKAIAVLYCMLALSNSRRRIPANNLDKDYMKWVEQEEVEKDKEDLPPVDWKAQKEEYEKQIKKLRSALHSAEKTAEEAKKKLEQQKSASEAEHRELADLREVVFNKEEFEHYDGSAEEIPDESVYPYTVQKSTVVFGGHETWIKVLKPMLKGDIKFIVKEMKIDVSLVRYAEVIWIQCNAIPHRSYYSIVNTARKLGKPIRYFTNASAVKCAEQIVENDKRK